MKRLVLMNRLSFCLFLLLAGCQLQHGQSPADGEWRFEHFGREIRQAVLVSANDPHARSAVTIRLLERGAHGWREAGIPMAGVAGRNGIVPEGQKREGDGRTPGGVYPLERGFGYAPLETKIPYTVLTPEMVWIDDPASPRYNMLSTRTEADGFSHEVMRRKDDLYRCGIVIEYNTKKIVPGAGSAIFFHVWNGPGTSTAGCVAAPASDVVRILRWLDPAKRPVIVIHQLNGGGEGRTSTY